MFAKSRERKESKFVGVGDVEMKLKVQCPNSYDAIGKPKGAFRDS